jgi:N-methylhydantoinase A
MRYVGQEHSVAVRMPAHVEGEASWDEIKRLFDEAHQIRYSHSAPEESADVVSLRVSAIGQLSKPRLPEITSGAPTPPSLAKTGTRTVVFHTQGAELETAVFDRARLLAGNVIEGPAVIEEPASTTVVEPGDRVTVDRFGHLVMSLGPV